jgi:hypothetical protein
MAKTGMSIRLRPDLKEQLERRARERGTSAAALYERFVDEGIRRDDHPLIFFRDGAGGRRATLLGTRLSVAQVIETIEAADSGRMADRIKEAAEYLEIPVGQVQACVHYYVAYKDEIDEWRHRVAEIAERERAAWQREQAVFV